MDKPIGTHLKDAAQPFVFLTTMAELPKINNYLKLTLKKHFALLKWDTCNGVKNIARLAILSFVTPAAINFRSVIASVAAKAI